MASETPDASLDLQHYARMLWRRKGVVFLSTLTVFSSALVAVNLMPNEYEATVQLSYYEPAAVMPGIAPVGTSGSREVDRTRSLAARIRSRPFLERVVQTLQMTTDPALRATAEEVRRKNPRFSVDEIATRIVVERIQRKLQFGTRGVGIYEVIVADPDPTTAQLVANFIGEFYRDDSKQQANKRLAETIAWTEDQLKAQEEEVKRAEERLEQYEAESTREMLPRNAVRSSNLSLAEVVQRRLRQEVEDVGTRVQVSNRDGASDAIEKASAAIRREAEFEQFGKRLSASLIGAIDDILTLEAIQTGSPVWPPSGSQQSALRQKLRTRLEERARSRQPQANSATIGAIVDHAFFSIYGQANAEAAQVLDQRILDYTARVKEEPAQELELKRLGKEIQEKRELLERFRSTETVNRIRRAIEDARLGLEVEILEPPQLPISPSRPNRAKILLSAVVLGVMLGFGLAFLSETMDPTLRTLAEIRRVAPEPVLGTTPLLRKLQPRTRGLRRFWLPAAVSAVILLTTVFFMARSTVLRDAVPGAGTGKAIAPDSTRGGP